MMFVKTLNIVLADWIRVSGEGLTPLLERKIHERLVFTNPDYEMRHNRGEWIGNIPPQISCMRQKGRNYLLPRGFLDQFLELCRKFQQPFRIVDRRRFLDPLPMEFHGQLKSYQQDAAEAVLERDFATLVGGHKSGKTVIALYTIAQRKQPTLIILPKLDLLDGWLTKIENFLQIPKSEVGIFANGSHEIGEAITIAHSGEMMRFWRKVADHVGYLILDECQRSPSKVFTHLIPNFSSQYMLGLTNTTQRKDRLSKLVYYYMGDVVYSINEKDAREGRGIIHAQVIAKSTDFEYPYRSRADYQLMLEALVHDEKRTRLIADDIESEIKAEPGPLLVLSGSDEQDAALGAELTGRGIEIFKYAAAANAQEPAEEMEDDEEEEAEAVKPCPAIDFGDRPVAVFTSPQVLSRCFHQLNFKVLVLATPVYFPKAMAKAIQNLHVNGTGESRLKIYDYVDKKIGLLENYFRMRSYTYGVHPDVLLGSDTE